MYNVSCADLAHSRFMATPRKSLIDPEIALYYHLVSRCVRRGFLCGIDPLTGKDYNHRKAWIIERLHFLAQYFAVDLCGYAVMSNHFHLNVFHDPIACRRWSDEAVADRWLAVSPPRTYHGEAVKPDVFLEAKTQLLSQAKRLKHVRKALGSISTFMKFLKQHIARRANAEEGVTGHFFEQRFWSGALLDERAVMSAMLYIDLNPVRAKIAKTIEDTRHAGITERLAELAAGEVSLEDYLKPLVSGLKNTARKIVVTLRSYLTLLNLVIDLEVRHPEGSPESCWQIDIASLHRRQRAYGSEDHIRSWGSARQWKRLGVGLVG